MNLPKKNSGLLNLVLFLSFLAFFFTLVYNYSSIQADGYYYLDAGKRIIQSKELPQRDVFSFNTSFTYWRIVEWLPDIIFYSIFNSVGEKALLFLIPLIFGFIFLIFWYFFDGGFSAISLAAYSCCLIVFYRDLFIIRAELLMCLYFFLFFYYALYKQPSGKTFKVLS